MEVGGWRTLCLVEQSLVKKIVGGHHDVLRATRSRLEEAGRHLYNIGVSRSPIYHGQSPGEIVSRRISESNNLTKVCE